MKRFYPLLSILVLLLNVGCKKELNQTLISNKNPQIDSVIQFLKSNLPGHISTLNLESIKELKYNHKNIGFQIFEKYSTQKFLILRKEASVYAGNWVDFSALKENQKNNYSGEILLESLNDGINSKLVVENNKVIQIQKQGKTLSSIIRIIPRQRNSPGTNNTSVMEQTELQDYIVLQEVIVVKNNVDFISLFWLFDAYSPFSYYYLSENFPGTMGDVITGGNYDLSLNNENDNIVAMPVFQGPKTPIKDLKEELKCFTVNSNSSYSISINVNQPRPNSRDKIDISQDFMVGHTYLTLQQKNSDGTKIVRNVGLYPQSIVYPGSQQDVSIFGEDSNTPFSASLNISVSGSEMNTVINSLLNQQSRKYDLSNFNCVNSSALALGSIGIYLPLTISGIDFLYQGVNPGDLGQDIRNLDLKGFSENNGNRKMEKTESNKNDMKPPQKSGGC